MTAWNLQVLVDGQYLSGITGWSGLKYTNIADGGCDIASVDVHLLERNAVPSQFRRNKDFVVSCGGVSVWKGKISEFDRENGTVSAVGLSRYGDKYLCLNSSGLPTLDANDAIVQAVARGLPWSYTSGLFGGTLTATTSGVKFNTINTMIQTHCDAAGVRWGVSADGVLFYRVDDTTPTWALRPGLGVPSYADDPYYSDLYASYFNGTSYVAVTQGDASSRTEFGRAEYGIDLTDLGTLTSTQANVFLTGKLSKVVGRNGFTNAVTVADDGDIMTIGGTPAFIPTIQPGQIVRNFATIDNDAAIRWGINQDFVIGSVSVDVDERKAVITPVGFTARDFGTILTDPQLDPEMNMEFV